MIKRDNYLLHIVLFLITLFTTTLAGAEWVTGQDPVRLLMLGKTFQEVQSVYLQGLYFSIPFLAFLTVHEFGHYFTALYNKVKCSLPFYIPFYIPLVTLNIGSMGAVIRLKEAPDSTRKFFDIGIAGPLAGFVIAVFVLSYGFLTLPDPNAYILNIHPDYQQDYCGVPSNGEFMAMLQAHSTDENKASVPFLGSSLLYSLLQWMLVDDTSRIPPFFEIMHYPFLVVGFLSLFFTALNLLPIGQLDGGHITFGMFGQKNAAIISRVTVCLLLFVGGLGIPYLNLDLLQSDYRQALFDFIPWTGVYMLFALWVGNQLFPFISIKLLVLGMVALVAVQFLANVAFGPFEPAFIWLVYSFISVRFLGIDHPPVLREEPLGTGRKILGWLSILIFILCFSPNVLQFATAQ